MKPHGCGGETAWGPSGSCEEVAIGGPGGEGETIGGETAGGMGEDHESGGMEIIGATLSSAEAVAAGEGAPTAPSWLEGRVQDAAGPDPQEPFLPFMPLPSPLNALCSPSNPPPTTRVQSVWCSA